MKLIVVSASYNEAPFVPWFIRHWTPIADRLIVYDDHSNDGTPELLHAAGVELRTWAGTDGIDETQRLLWAHSLVGEFINQADWLAVVDFDELLFGPYKFYAEFRPILEEELAKGTEVIQTHGFNMTGQLGHDGLPDPALPGQIWEHIQWGVWAPIYAKPIVVRPGARIGWSRGRHCLEGCQPIMSFKPRLKLLHYRYLGPEYTARRNARNLARCGLISKEKGAAWSCEPWRNSAKQEGTALWSVKAQRESFNVIELPI